MSAATARLRKTLYLPFEKVEEQDDGSLIVSGIASSESADSEGETVKADAMRAAIPDYMAFGAIREMHQPIAAGTALAASVDNDGVTHLEAHIVDESSVKKVKARVLKGFSIGGKVTKRNATDRKIIEGIKLAEISLVDRPANPDALITLVKFDSEGRVVDAPKPKKSSAAKLAAMAAKLELKKGLYDVQRLASLISDLSWLIDSAEREAETEGDDSTVPDQLRAQCTALCMTLRDMVTEETAELLGLDGDEDVLVAAAAKSGPLAKKGAKFSKATVGTLATVHKMLTDGCDMMGKLGYTDTANQEEEMTDSEKAAAAAALQKAAGTGDPMDILTKMQADIAALQAGSSDLATKHATAEAERDAALTKAANAEATAQKLADAVVAGGTIRVVPKEQDASGANPDDAVAKALKEGKVADFSSELRASFSKPMSPIRGMTPATRAS